MRPETAALIGANTLEKGDVLATARLAGIMAAKRTWELIPLCHPVALTDVQVHLEAHEDHVEIRATATALGRTGVEMEALTAVAAAALTVYDMAKAVDRGMQIDAVRLVRKSGGVHGDWEETDDSGGHPHGE
jgi:cyclic pyranopterin phosphate synthase